MNLCLGAHLNADISSLRNRLLRALLVWEWKYTGNRKQETLAIYVVQYYLPAAAAAAAAAARTGCTELGFIRASFDFVDDSLNGLHYVFFVGQTQLKSSNEVVRGNQGVFSLVIKGLDDAL